MFSTVTQLASLFLALAATTLATPLVITQRDVVDPPITSPTAKTVWTVGETETVTWYVLWPIVLERPHQHLYVIGTLRCWRA